MNALFPTDELPAAGSVVVVGVPTDENSSFIRGACRAPDCIRSALHCASSNLCAENGIELADDSRFTDLGNLDIGTGAEARDQITASFSQLLERTVKPVALGGDHSITYPILRSFAAVREGLTVLQFDAHPDLYDSFGGKRFSNASPFARIMEEKLADRLIQVGIRAMNSSQRRQAERFAVETIELQRYGVPADLELGGPVYVSIDIDVLDPAFAPGVSHPEPGGLSTRQVLDMLQRIRVPIVGADIVEFNPDRDLGELTARTAAKLLKEIAGIMLQGG